MWTAIWVIVALLLALALVYVLRKSRSDQASMQQQLSAAVQQAAHQATEGARAAERTASGAATSAIQKVRNVVDVSAHQLREYLRDPSHDSVVMFHAPWCGNCTAMQPAYEKYGKGAGDKVHVLRLNCDQYPDAAEAFGIEGFPTIKLFGQGREKAEYQGDRTPGSLLAFASGH